jgi:hypothetical protein
MKILQLEEERNQALEALSGAVPERTRLRILVRFFESAGGRFDFPLLQSYYLEFSSAFFQALSESSLRHSEPGWPARVSAVVEAYASGLPEAAPAETVGRCMRVIHAASAESHFLLGEWDQGFASLERASGEILGGTVRDRTAQALKNRAGLPASLRPIFGTGHPETLGICSAMTERWKEQFHERRPDRLNLLFVDVTGGPEIPESGEGVILPVRIRSFLRPRRAEEDAIRLANDWMGKTGSFARRMREVLGAVRGLLGSVCPGPAERGRFLFQFSIPEREAGYGGNSLEAPTGLLLAGGMINAWYGRTVVRFDPATAVTAGLDADGGLTAVEGVKAKIRAAFFSPIQRVVVPWRNLREAMDAVEELRIAHPGRRLTLESAERLEELFDDRNLVIRRKITWPLAAFAAFARNREKTAWLAAALVLLSLLGILFFNAFFTDRNPVSLDIAGNLLTVKNAEGKELWEHDFGAALTRRRYTGEQSRAVWTDADGDGKNELLFGVYENELPGLSGRLFCFDSDGTVRFQIKTGRAMRFGAAAYEDHYRVAFAAGRDLDGDGVQEILSISHQYPWFPCVVNVWSLKGEKLGEYWHAGQLERLETIDLDGDGTKEIIAMGQNNEYNCAVLAVLPAFGMSGASPQTRGGPYDAAGSGPGRERFYIRFPQSEIFRLSGNRDYAIQALDRAEGIQIGVANGGLQQPGAPAGMILFYLFDREFRPKEIQIGDSYRIAVRRLSGRNDLKPMGPLLVHGANGWNAVEAGKMK